MGATSLISSYIEGQQIRPTVINWSNFLKAIVDGYERAEGIVHGVQKDAIQNGWDARLYKKGKDWKFIFELIETKNRSYLSMIDEGTCGLTGRILSPADLQKDLPEEERWGRFENLAFIKTQSKEKTTLGSRGRGKFIFVGASKINEIIYDSLREDKTYRFGVRKLETTESPTFSWDEEEARKILYDMTDGIIKPLEKIGTRVVIIDPIEELKNSIKSGEFSRYVGETWWEIILKYDIKIYIKYGSKEELVHIPEEFKLEDSDDEDYLVWVKKNIKEKRGTSEFKIKKLHIMYSTNKKISVDIRGVSIQRGGMKITKVYAYNLSKDMSDRIYGYITLDKESERILQQYEDPEHYSFSKRAYPNSLKNYIESEINDFAKTKLGWGTDPRVIWRQRTRNAERKALAAINDVAAKMGLMGVGVGRRKGGGGGYSPAKLIRIAMPELELPRKNDLRINYGEKVDNIGCEIINDSDRNVNVKCKIYIRKYDDLIDTFYDADLCVNKKLKSEFIGPFNISFNENDATAKGEYIVVSRIISLDDISKGDILDEKRTKFWLEEDPPKGGLFESCDGIPFPEEANKYMGEAVPGSRGGWMLQYNINHPEYELIQDDEEEAASYLYKILSHELCRIDLLEENPKLFELDQTENPDYILKRTLELIGEFSALYYQD